MALLDRLRDFFIDDRYRAVIIDERARCPLKGVVGVRECMSCPRLDEVANLGDGGAIVEMVVCEPARE